MIRFYTPVLATTMLLSSMAVHAAIPSGDRAALTANINAGDGPAVTLSVNRILSSSLDKRDGPVLETLASTLGDAGYRDAAGGLLVRAAELIDVPSSESEREAVVRIACLLYTSPSPRDQRGSRMPSSA